MAENKKINVFRIFTKTWIGTFLIKIRILSEIKVFGNLSLKYPKVHGIKMVCEIAADFTQKKLVKQTGQFTLNVLHTSAIFKKDF